MRVQNYYTETVVFIFFFNLIFFNEDICLRIVLFLPKYQQSATSREGIDMLCFYTINKRSKRGIEDTIHCQQAETIYIYE